MLITRTPFRISFFGGGTDYYDYFSKYGGCVLSTTIDKYCYTTIRNLPPFFEYKNQFTYSKIERFNDVSEIQHPLVRSALKYMPIERIQIAYDADLPACSGIGSSSAFSVGLLQGLHAFKGEYPDKMTLAKQAIHIERTMCNEAGGVQDQIAAAFGGFNKITFTDVGYEVTPVEISEEAKIQLQENLILAFTGFTHFSGEIAIAQQKNIPSTISQLDEMKSLVVEAEKMLLSSNLSDFGRLLDHTWNLKRSLSHSISNSTIDEFYKTARENGALGGKLLGAGGGGFMLLYVPKEKQESFKNSIKELKYVPFKFENEGTQIIYNDFAE
jgi:D-glycero-alpha-D-manno-heptose-7-phosphate kinase